MSGRYVIRLANNEYGQLAFQILDDFHADNEFEACSRFDELVKNMGDAAWGNWINLAFIDGGIDVIREHGSMLDVLNTINPSK